MTTLVHHFFPILEIRMTKTLPAIREVKVQEVLLLSSIVSTTSKTIIRSYFSAFPQRLGTWVTYLCATLEGWFLEECEGLPEDSQQAELIQSLQQLVDINSEEIALYAE